MTFLAVNLLPATISIFGLRRHYPTSCQLVFPIIRGTSPNTNGRGFVQRNSAHEVPVVMRMLSGKCDVRSQYRYAVSAAMLALHFRDCEGPRKFAQRR